MKKRALVCGVSGQDGAYLSKLLLEKGYEVFGASRDAQANSFSNLKKLGIIDKIKLVSINLIDFRSVLQGLTNVQPSEVYNLSGQSSVGLSFEQPVETYESIGLATLNILEAIRFTKLPIKLYNAGSSECFGNTNNNIADENTCFKPVSPYGVSKSMAFWSVTNYRSAYNLFACTGILFNHESPLRPNRFVTSKIIDSVVKIANGSNEKLQLGNINISRDWGWAPEYVDAMWRILQQDTPEDFVIATGVTNTLQEFIEVAFNCVNLDWKNHVIIKEDLFRPTDLSCGKANPEKAFEKLNWKAQFFMKDVIAQMIEEKQKEKFIL